MTKNNQALLDEGTKKVATTKKNVAHKFIKSNLKTPYKIILEHPVEGENLTCLSNDDACKFIELYGNICMYNFFDENRVYLPIAEKKLVEFSPYSSYGSFDNLVDQFGKPASELIKMMEENRQPVLCLDGATANLACMLICARTQATLLSKHWKDLPNGEELLLKADNHFEELCSSLKIGRRTKSIINRKKAEGQANVENSNDN